MAAQKQISILAKKLGNKLTQAHAQVKDAPVEMGNARLPDGIENGVAKLVDIRFGEYKDGDHKGQPFFIAAGIMIKPEHHDGQKIEGMRTQIGPIPLCDTPKAQGKRKTFLDHYTVFLNELKKLGVDTSQTEAGTPEQVESFLNKALDILRTSQPTFGVRTWKGKPSVAFPNPRVNEEWLGLREVDEEVDPAGGVQADDAPPPDAPGTAVAAPGDGDLDLAALADIADADPTGETDDGKAACIAIQEAAEKAGHSLDAIRACGSWAEVAALATTAPDTTTAPEKKPDPVKGDQVGYKVDKAKPPVQCEVTSVDAKTQTVTLKNLTTKAAVVGGDKKLLKVKWDELV